MLISIFFVSKSVYVKEILEQVLCQNEKYGNSTVGEGKRL